MTKKTSTSCIANLPSELRRLLLETYIFNIEKYGSKTSAIAHLTADIADLLNGNSDTEVLNIDTVSQRAMDRINDHEHGYLGLVLFSSSMAISRCACRQVPCECDGTNSEKAVRLNHFAWLAIQKLSYAGGEGATHIQLHEAIHGCVRSFQQSDKHNLSELFSEMRPMLKRLGVNVKSQYARGYVLIED